MLSLYKDGLKKFDGYEDFKNVQIITPSKKGLIRNKRVKQKNPRTSKYKYRQKERKSITALRYLEKAIALCK